MKKVSVIVSLIVIFSIFLLLIYQSFAFIFFVKDHQIIKLTLRDNWLAPAKKELLVEVVRSKESTAQGLSNRESLTSQSGAKVDALLFIFDDKAKRRFWMKDMLFNIDICWLENNRFISCEREVPFPQDNQPLAIYISKLPTNLVLETLPNTLNSQDLSAKLFFKW